MRLLALIAGAMFGALGRHLVAALVGLPAWLVMFTAGLIGFAVIRSARRADTVPWIAAGIICALTLPASIEPPRNGVIGQVPAWVRGADLFDALQKLDEDPQAMLGRTIIVSGLWRPAARDSRAAVYRRVMTCCAADAIDVGFDVIPARPIAIPAGSRVKATGRVVMTLRDGEVRYELANAAVSF